MVFCNFSSAIFLLRLSFSSRKTTLTWPTVIFLAARTSASRSLFNCGACVPSRVKLKSCFSSGILEELIVRAARRYAKSTTHADPPSCRDMLSLVR